MANHTLHDAQQSFQFVTFTCFRWLPLFQETKIHDYLPFWFTKLKQRGCSLCGYVVMPNHIHMLLYAYSYCEDFNLTIGESKRFLAYEIVKRLKKNNKQQFLEILQKGVQSKEKAKGKRHQVFRLSFDAKEVSGNKAINKVLDYMHHNPVSGKWRLIDDYTLYPHSSAGFYERGINSNMLISDYRTVASESLSGDSEES